MKLGIVSIIIVGTVVLLSGCETTNSIPYKASTTNIIAIQQSLKPTDTRVDVGVIEMAPGTESGLMCRLMGPVKVAPGKTLPQYIKEAFIEELFAAGAYEVNAETVITGTIENIRFSSVSPASWEITMAVKSNRSPGYSVSVDYKFNTSFSAYSACKNVADAFAPAVQELLRLIVTNPGFSSLATL